MREKGDIIFTEADIIFTGGKDAALPFLIINNSLYIPILDRIWTILITIAVPIKERSRIDKQSVIICGFSIKYVTVRNLY